MQTLITMMRAIARAAQRAVQGLGGWGPFRPKD